MLVFLILPVLQLPAMLKHIPQHGQIFSLAGKYLNMFMSLGGSCLGSTIIKEESLDSPKGKNSIFKIIFIQQIRLRLKLFGNNKQMVLVQIEFIKQQSMSLSQLLNKEALDKERCTYQKGGKKGLRTSSLISLYFSFSLETSKNSIVMLLDSTVWVCQRMRDYLDRYAFSRFFKIRSWIYWIRITVAPRSLLQKRNPKKAHAIKEVTPKNLSAFFWVFYSQIQEIFCFHYKYDIIKIKIIYDVRRILSYNICDCYISQNTTQSSIEKIKYSSPIFHNLQYRKRQRESNVIGQQISKYIGRHNILHLPILFNLIKCEIQLNITYKMAPKPAPKLTKKQLQQLKKQELKKKEAEQLQHRLEQEARVKQKMRLDQIEKQKRQEEQRVRIVLQKEKYRQKLQTTMKQQNEAVNRLIQQRTWSDLTEEYHKSYDTSRPKLSTFIKVFEQQKYQQPKKTLKNCEQAETYVRCIGHTMLHYRGIGNKQQEKYYADSIIKIRKLEMQNLQKVMIEMANGAEQIEDKNSEINKKGQPNKKVEGAKVVQYQYYMNSLAKIGMFLNSSTTKNLNKFRPIEIKEFSLNTQIPSKWMNANTIVKFQWVNFNPFNPHHYDKFLLIGGVYILQFYQLLLGSKKINNIILKKSYKGSQVLDKFKLPTNLIKQPFNVAYQIPKYVFLHTFDQSTLRFAQFDYTSNKWSILPSDTVIEYDGIEKKATCRIFRPEPIAYVQQRCTDYPYVAWELRSVEPAKAQLDIELRRWKQHKQGREKSRLMVKFEIDAYSIRLVLDQHEKYPELKDLTEGNWTPSSILYELSQRGIHLLPIDEDYEEARIPIKNNSAENNAIRDIAYAIQAFYIRSQLNNSNDIIVKIRENPQYERVFLEDQEKDWKRIRWLSGDRCEVTNRNIKNRHLNLEILLEQHNICLPACVDRMKYQKNYLFKKNIMQLLTLTRILSFSSSVAEQSTLRQVLKQKQVIRV